METSNPLSQTKLPISALLFVVALLAQAAHDDTGGPVCVAPFPTQENVATPGASTSNQAVALQLPPLPPDVTELEFSDCFKYPVGPRGLELTEKLLSLDGKHVRIFGYMIQQTDPAPRCFLFSPRPVKMHEQEYGFADELPASTIHVFTDTSAPETVPFTPGPLLLTGTLSVGNRQEPSGRVSLVRLQLDPPTQEQREALLHAVDLVGEGRTKGPADYDHGHNH